MIGYWVDSNPVKTDNDKVLATIYKKDKKAMIAIASWATDDAKVKLHIDWKALGIDPAKATITAPEIKGFQAARKFGADEDILVSKGKGWLLVVQ
jgi:hypothetical protein